MRWGIILLASVALLSNRAKAQQGITDDDLQLNTITTAVPFLLIAPDSRSGGMGDVGVSTTPDANSIHWNASQIAHAANEFEVGVSYVPWLSDLVPGINLAYLSGYKKVDRNSGFGGSLRYFSLGDITFTDIAGNQVGFFSPTEFAIDAAYGRMLGEKISGGMAVRYVFSNLTGGFAAANIDTKPGQALAVDLNAYYYNPRFKLGKNDATFGAGFNISNIGNKVAYTETSDRDFLPMNLRLGPTLGLKLDDYNSLSFTAELNKLLVPSPPIYELDSLGNPLIQNGKLVIASGFDPEVGVASGLFRSFYDAPGVVVEDDIGNRLYNPDGTLQIEKGSRFREELREINISLAMEYWYDEQFALRAGYFYEHPTKGARKFFTLGAGLRYNIFALDFSYLIATTQRNPLANTLRFTLRFNFETLQNKDTEG